MNSGAPSSIPGPNVVLGLTPSRPDREPHVSAVYGNRNASGLYGSVADQIEAMGKDAMANIDYPDDFSRHIEQWSKNHRYVDKEGNELRTAIIGEILGPAKGTLIRAHGNYFAREGDDVRSHLMFPQRPLLNCVIRSSQSTTRQRSKILWR